MRLSYVLHVIGALTMCIGLTMFWPLAFSLYYDDSGVYPLLYSIGVTLLSGALLFLVFRSPGSARG